MSVEDLNSGNKTQADLAEAQKNKDIAPALKKGGPIEDPETVLLAMGKAYENKDFKAFMAHVSESYTYRGEMEEFIRRDFRDYVGLRLNFFVNRVVNSPDGASVKADWQIQFFPTAISSPVEVRGSNLDFIFVNEEGALKLKAQRGANPLFGARSPEVATAAGVSSSVANTLKIIEDTGSRSSRQTALSVVGARNSETDPHGVPVGVEMSNPRIRDTAGTTFSLNSIITSPTAYYLQIDVRLTDNPRNVDLRNIEFQVTDSRSGAVLRGTGNLLAGRSNTIITSDTITLVGPASGTFAYVLDPAKQFTFIDRRDATDREPYNFT